MTGSIVRERGEILEVSQTVAAANLQRYEREASVAESVLGLARSRAELCGEMARAAGERVAARARVGERSQERRDRREELR